MPQKMRTRRCTCGGVDIGVGAIHESSCEMMLGRLECGCGYLIDPPMEADGACVMCPVCRAEWVGVADDTPSGKWKRMTLQDRIKRLARVLCVTPTDSVRLELSWVTGVRRWWLCGCVEGDTALPRSGGANTEKEALDAAEAWLAPKIDRKEAGCG
jgi:hypothetical protein